MNTSKPPKTKLPILSRVKSPDVESRERGLTSRSPSPKSQSLESLRLNSPRLPEINPALKRLKQENFNLRRRMKEINNRLKTIKESEESEGSETAEIEQELKSAQKTLEIYQKDWESVQKKYSKISDPLYEARLLVEIKRSEETINEFKKSNRSSQNIQKQYTKQLGELEMNGPVGEKDYNDLLSELSVEILNLQEVEKTVEKQEKTLEETNRKEENLLEEYCRLTGSTNYNEFEWHMTEANMINLIREIKKHSEKKERELRGEVEELEYQLEELSHEEREVEFVIEAKEEQINTNNKKVEKLISQEGLPEYAANFIIQ